MLVDDNFGLLAGLARGMILGGNGVVKRGITAVFSWKQLTGLVGRRGHSEAGTTNEKQQNDDRADRNTPYEPTGKWLGWELQ